METSETYQGLHGGTQAVSAKQTIAVRGWGRPALTVFLATRLPVLVVGLVAVQVVSTWPPPVDPAVWRVYRNEILNLPARWDAFWYCTIAADGYHWSGNTLQQQSVVFFPLYPLLLKIGALATGQILWTGVAISLAAFFGALAYLYRLARLDLPQDQATTALALLASYPFAVFFGAPYTESLFLLEAAAAFYYLRRDRAAPAGVAAFLAGLTRPHGCVLVLPLAWLALQPAIAAAGAVATETQRRRAHLPLWLDAAVANVQSRRVIAAAMPIAGVLTYSAYLFLQFGHPFVWVQGQAAWGLTFVPGPRAELTVGPHVGTPVASAIVLVGNIAALILAALMIRPVARRFGAAYALLVAVYITPAFLAHAFTSAGRFTSVLFPIFFGLAASIPPSRRWRWIGAFAAGQALAAALFYTWRPLV